MTINIGWKALKIVATTAVSVAAAWYLAKYVAKKEEERREKLDAHKEEALDGRDLEKELGEASIHNDILYPGERASAYKILEEKMQAVNSARYISDFDKALKDFDEAIKCLTQEDKNAATACLFVYEKRMNQKKEEEVRKRELERDRERNLTELKKVSTIAKAIKQITDNQIDVTGILKQASEISNRTKEVIIL